MGVVVCLRIQSWSRRGTRINFPSRVHLFDCPHFPPRYKRTADPKLLCLSLYFVKYVHRYRNSFLNELVMTTLLNANASSISNTLATQTQATTVVSGHRSNKISTTNQPRTRKGTKDSCSRCLASNVCLTRGSHDCTTNSTSKAFGWTSSEGSICTCHAKTPVKLQPVVR
jgi:hypothetical protein